MKRILHILLIALLVAGSSDAVCQKREKRVSTKKQMKDQAKNKESAKAEIEGRYAQNKDRHSKIQGKSTQKRMKRNRREVHRRNKGTHIPFYKRWFRKRHFK